MELKEISATYHSPYRCYVRGTNTQTEGENVNTIGFKDGLAVVQAMPSTDTTDKMQKLQDNAIDSKTIDISKLKKIIVKVDPLTGKKYIFKDGKKIEILPQLNNPVFHLNDNRFKIKSIVKPGNSVAPQATLDEQIKPNIIIKQASGFTSVGHILQNSVMPKIAKPHETVVVNKRKGAMKVIDNIKYHVLSLNVKKQGLHTKTSIATMTDYDLPPKIDKNLQTDDCSNKADSCTQTEPLYGDGGEFPLSDQFVNFLLDSGEYDDLSNRKMIDPKKLTTKEEINKFNFFNDMRNALNFDRSGNLPIHESVMRNNVKAVKKNCIVLKAIKENVNILNQQCYAPLHLAILHEVNLEIVQILLNHGADLGVADGEGNTAIHLAIENNRAAVLKVLVTSAYESRFTLDVFNYEGFTPLILACLNQSYDNAKLLLQHHADPNIKDMKSGRTALFHAAECHDVRLVELLMEHKADTKIRNFFGTSAHDAMFEVEDMPLKIKFCILGRDHQRFQNRRKIEGKSVEPTMKRAKLETTPVLRKVSSSDMIKTRKK